LDLSKKKNRYGREGQNELEKGSDAQGLMERKKSKKESVDKGGRGQKGDRIR